jgi:hypothetical protein
MNIESTWSALKGAINSNKPTLVMRIAAQLADEMRASGGRPAEMVDRTLAAWAVDNPTAILPVAAKIVRSLDPELRHLVDYMLMAVDEGEGLSLLVPKSISS